MQHAHNVVAVVVVSFRSSIFSLLFYFCNVYCCRCHTIVDSPPCCCCCCCGLLVVVGFLCGLCNIVEFFAGQVFHLDCCSHRH